MDIFPKWTWCWVILLLVNDNVAQNNGLLLTTEDSLNNDINVHFTENTEFHIARVHDNVSTLSIFADD